MAANYNCDSKILILSQGMVMTEMKLGLGLYRHMLTDENFAFARQCGCTHLVVHLVDYYGKEIVTATDAKTNYGRVIENDPIWQAGNLLRLQKMAAEHELTIYAIENFSPADWYDVLLDGPRREEQMARLRTIIRNTGKAGIRAFGYNFSLAGVWGHQKRRAARGGAVSTCFDASAIAVDSPIPKGDIWNMTYAGGDGSFLNPIFSQELWDRFQRFLLEILPVAEESGVELALHPDDPPYEGLRGMPRLVYTADQYQRVLGIDKSPSNKLEFCMGSIQEMERSDIFSALRQYAGQQSISYIHFRNVKGKVPRYDEVFVDEGDIDMLKALAVLDECGYSGLLVPDHTPEPTCPGSWYAGMAFALGYMRAAMQLLERGSLRGMLLEPADEKGNA